MRQNFIADNIVKLELPQVAESGLYLYVDTGFISGLNKASGISFNSGNSSRTITLDISSDALFSFDVSIASQNVGASGDVSFVVCTYAATAPNSGQIGLDITPRGFFTPLVIGDRATVSGRCIVPKLDLADGETQYLALGLVDSTGANIPCTSKYIQSRIHTEDIQVFDPLRN